jgi:hypothetical protein
MTADDSSPEPSPRTNAGNVKTPRSAGQLERAVRAYARAKGVAEKRVRDWISYMALGGCLEAAAHARGEGRQFTFKGGVVMELRRGGAARATQDLDLTFHGDDDDVVIAVESALVAPYGRFSFRRSGTPYRMTQVNTVRLELAVRFDGQPWGTIVVDVSRGDKDAIEVELLLAFDIEADFGIAGPERLPCISARYHLAHKLHGMTKETPEGAPNERVQDAVDALLLRDFVGELSSVREACVHVFEARNQHTWPPTFVPPPTWADRFSAMAAELEMDIQDLASATSELQGFIDAINAANQPSDVAEQASPHST